MAPWVLDAAVPPAPRGLSRSDRGVAVGAPAGPAVGRGPGRGQPGAGAGGVAGWGRDSDGAGDRRRSRHRARDRPRARARGVRGGARRADARAPRRRSPPRSSGRPGATAFAASADLVDATAVADAVAARRGRISAASGCSSTTPASSSGPRPTSSRTTSRTPGASSRPTSVGRCWSPTRCCPAMLARGGGRVLNLNSGSGYRRRADVHGLQHQQGRARTAHDDARRAVPRPRDPRCSTSRRAYVATDMTGGDADARGTHRLDAARRGRRAGARRSATATLDVLSGRFVRAGTDTVESLLAAAGPDRRGRRAHAAAARLRRRRPDRVRCRGTRRERRDGATRSLGGQTWTPHGSGGSDGRRAVARRVSTAAGVSPSQRSRIEPSTAATSDPARMPIFASDSCASSSNASSAMNSEIVNPMPGEHRAAEQVPVAHAARAGRRARAGSRASRHR